MSGVRKGLSGRILEQSKKAFYTHCTSHALNLCIAATCKEHNSISNDSTFNIF